jgi:hypothetical protein
MFEQAVREKLRFDSPKGPLSVEDLWDLPLTSARGANLNDIAKDLNRQLKAEGEEDFVNPTAKRNTLLQLAFDIVKHIIVVRKAEAEAARQATVKREQRARIQELIAKKQDQELEGKSLEELNRLIETL